jgi:phage terminase large subunit
MIKDIEGTVVLEQNYEALFDKDERFIVNIGGSRSSKTVSLCQLIIIYAYSNPDKVISIVRKTFPALRATVMRDFFDVLKQMDLYDKANHNKTEHIYTFPNGTIVEFFSVDDEQKIRGRKRDICWANEANELLYDDFQQLNFRTTFKLLFDFNPSESSSWLYDLDSSNKILIKSSYKDNPFLDKAIVKEIEQLQFTDPELWTIYGLGERATSKLNVYTHFQQKKQKPEYFRDFIYAIDFGYNHPTALLKIWFNEKEVFIEELIYESYLTSADLVERFETLGIDKKKEMIADHARPEIIEEIKRAGYNIKEADKSVKKGIDKVKRTIVHIDILATNTWKEFENYKYKKVGDKITDDVVKLWDDAMDALRYGITYIANKYSYSRVPTIRILR